jgi:DNA-binding beta-propeller fold protein YncE
MRLNGGILGRANEPTLDRAGGIWSFKERELQQLYNNFPRFNEGWTLKNVASQQLYHVQSFSVSSQDTTPTGIAFKPDGTKMYIVGGSGDDVNEYTLSSAWDVSTASYVQNFSVAAEELTPEGIAFKPDGTKMYIVGGSGDDVYEYTLSAAWDVSTASYVQNFSVAAEELNPTGLDFKPDGTKMYIVGSAGDDVNEYTLSSAWDISTASYVQSFSVATQDSIPDEIAFKPDGTKMYIVGGSGDDVNEYTLSSAWDVSTASYVQNFSVATQDTTPKGIAFKPDGTKMYIVGAAGDDVYEYTLSSAWDVSTALYSGISFSVSSRESGPTGIAFKPDGTKMYIVGSGGDEVNEYTLRTAWSLKTPGFIDSQIFSVATEESAPTGIAFKPDGTKMYIVGSAEDDVNEYTLSAAWDISTASYVQSFSVSSQESVPKGIAFKPDGTKMYIVGAAGDDVYEYTLSAAWDVSTASYVQSFSVAAEELTPEGIAFKPDGTKMYIVGSTGDDVNEYTLSSAWDVSTASYVQSFSVATQESAPTGIAFKPDGTIMYIVGSAEDDVNEYTLSSAWDISTASYVQSFSIEGQDSTPTGIAFKPAGTIMYIVGSAGDAVYQYYLG